MKILSSIVIYNSFGFMKLSLEEIQEIVKETCRKVKECIYVIIFGSRAIGTDKCYSDLDVAIMFDDQAEDVIKISQDIAFEIEEKTEIKTEVVPLNIADTVLKYEVYSQGILVYCRDYERYLDDKLNAIDQYLDFQEIFQKHYKRVVREILNAYSRS